MCLRILEKAMNLTHCEHCSSPLVYVGKLRERITLSDHCLIPVRTQLWSEIRCTNVVKCGHTPPDEQNEAIRAKLFLRSEEGAKLEAVRRAAPDLLDACKALIASYEDVGGPLAVGTAVHLGIDAIAKAETVQL